MTSFTEDQKYDDNILFQRIELVFTKAANWETCTMPMSTTEMVARVREEQGIFFHSDELVVLVMEYLDFPYKLNENNQKHYWLLNPSDNE